MNNFISVIVPIYNVENYISECIESILSQTYHNFELILVDDGSPDNCSEICDSYAKKDNRIKVIHKKNGGLVSARKAGLNISSGKYILNVDGDDYVESDMLERMLKLAEKNDADIVITGYNSVEERKIEKKRNVIDSGVYSGESYNKLIESLVYTGVFYEQAVIPAVWNKLFRREVYFDLQNHVPDEIRMGEDFAVTYPTILNSSIIVVDNEFKPYNYRILNNSMSRSIDLSYFERIKVLFDYLDKSITNYSVNQQLNYYKLFLLMIGCNNYLFSSLKNILHKNYMLKNIIKQFKSVFFNNIIVNDSFNDEVILFLKAVRKNSYLCYFFKHYLDLCKNKFKGILHKFK